jgi:uncharacterized iron-regulated membrane protein
MSLSLSLSNTIPISSTSAAATDNSALIGGIVGGVAGAFVLIGLVIVVIVFRKRRVQTSVSSSPTTTPTPISEPEMRRYEDVDAVRRPPPIY